MKLQAALCSVLTKCPWLLETLTVNGFKLSASFKCNQVFFFHIINALMKRLYMQ